MEEEQEARYKRWKGLIPVLYDWFTNHNLVWPSLSCRWGGMIEDGAFRSQQQLYYSEQTSDNYPNTIVVTNCDVLKPRVATAENLSQFNEGHKSPYLKKVKTIIHPGEVNRIREMPQNCKILATHTDKREVFIWNVESQPTRSPTPGAASSKPDMVLTGHTDIAAYALAFSQTEPLVLSGGKDRNVILWDIKEPMSSLKPPGRPTLNSGGLPFSSTIPAVKPKNIFKGHNKPVEDVQFRASSIHEFCSVGDDRCLIFWDTRHGTDPVLKVANAHADDIHCVDYNTHQDNYVLTGSADNTVKLFDIRMLQEGSRSPLNEFRGHECAVLGVQWCPAKASVFATSGSDSTLNLWDFEKVTKSAQPNPLNGLFFKHVGHRGQIVDFHWNPLEPWLLTSISTDVKGGGTLQIWRILDLLYRPEDEVLSELSKLEV